MLEKPTCPERAEAAQFLESMRENFDPSESLGANFLILMEKLVPQLANNQTLLWNVYAQVYLKLNLLRPYRELQETIIDCLDIELDQNLKIVNLGCGSANLELELAKKGKTQGNHFHCVDNSAAMIAEARRNFPAGTYYQKDLTAGVPFIGNKSADRVVCANMLGFLEKEKATELLKEIQRILRPLGKVVLTTQQAGASAGKVLAAHSQQDCSGIDANDPQNFPHLLNLAFDESSEETKKDVLTVSSCTLATTLHNRGQVAFTPNESEIRSIFKEAGFQDIRVRPTYADQFHLIEAVPSNSTRSKIARVCQ